MQSQKTKRFNCGKTLQKVDSFFQPIANNRTMNENKIFFSFCDSN